MPSLQSLLKPCTLNSSVVANLFHMMQSVALRAVMPSTYSPKPRPKSCNPSGGCYLFRYRSIRRLVDGKRRWQPGEHTNPKALRPKPAATSPKLLAPKPKTLNPAVTLLTVTFIATLIVPDRLASASKDPLPRRCRPLKTWVREGFKRLCVLGIGGLGF